MFGGVVKRLSSDKDYVKPERTYQESLTNEEIEEKLKDYSRISMSDLETLPIYTHLRYITINDKNDKSQNKFRIGGWLSNNKNCSKYIVLTNGKKSWSVQTRNAVFYRQQSKQELKNIKNVEKRMRNYMRELKKENSKLREILSKKRGR